jgi:Protein of unknown function (DUF2817)
MGAALPSALPNARIDFVLQEIGTYPMFTVLQALRAENCWHHCSAAQTRHSAKLALLEALRPDTANWRRRALVHGISTAHAAARWAFRDGP